MIMSRLLRVLKWVLMGLGLALLALLAVRAWDARRGAPLQPWHTYVPDEPRAAELDELDWAAYLNAEAAIFDRVRSEVTERLDEEDRVPVNRYFDGSPLYAGRFSPDWNRSYVLEPEGTPAGAVVFLHGLTDSPYSSRHLARLYRAEGYVSVAIRLPAHGTVPGALTDVEWEDWLAATRLAVREARRLAGPSAPLHLVGYSNGGALAVKYALDALDDDRLPRPDRLILLSPMIGVTRFARFAGVIGWPAVLPAFARAAWISIMPEFNPFKYNSFPVNAARQSYQLSATLQDQIARAARDRRIDRLAPVLTFQSVMDFTVLTRALVTALYAQLPANGSEIVLFDLNRAATVSPLLSSAAETKLASILPPPPRRFRTTIITNAGPGLSEVVEQTTAAGEVTEQTRPLGLSYPADVYSLSHIAIPFPVDDGLYGLQPDPRDDFGINLGVLAPRGERGTLIASKDGLLRLTSNPFFPYLLDRIAGEISP